MLVNAPFQKLAVLILLASSVLLLASSTQKEKPMQSLTPVLSVEEIEPCLDFWVGKLGFEKIAEVPEGDKLGFVMLKNGPVEVMLQSRASILKDVEAMGKGPFAKDGVSLYIKVASLDDWLPKLAGVEVVVPERKTFYGAREIAVRAPSGVVVGFAEFSEESAE
jgi:uncharacterized glyoxalase superfamily protein PhnB